MNPYKVLGVKSTDDEATIKKAYRDLARKYHPDKCKNNPAAEKLFKEVNAAYDVLKDPAKKAQHQQQQNPFRGQQGRRRTVHFGNGPTGFPDLDDLFRQQNQHHQPRIRGNDIHQTITLDYEDILTDHEVQVTIPDLAGGTSKKKTYKVKIPKGVDTNGIVRMKGLGHPGQNAANGDVILNIKFYPHPFFERVGPDLHHTVDVTLSQAVLGARVEVPTLEGKARFRVPSGTQHGKEINILEKGLPIQGGKGKRGKVVYKVNIAIPETIPEDHKHFFEQLQKLGY